VHEMEGYIFKMFDLKKKSNI